MNDIERAIEQLEAQVVCTDNVLSINSCNLAISALEKQLNSGWTPVSEGLPNEYGNYQITNHDEDVEEATFVPSMSSGLIYGWSVCHADGSHSIDDDYVTAWQPLPEPWKESVEE